MKTLYVGNLAPEVTEEELRALFAVHGEVVRATLATDPATGRSRGFGFVELASGDRHAQPGAEVAARLPDAEQEAGTQFIRELLEFPNIQLARAPALVDGVQQGGSGG